MMYQAFNMGEKIFLFLLLVCLCPTGFTCQEVITPFREPICLTGTYHKSKPSPEGPEYKACPAFKNSTCCTSQFTDMLSSSPVRKIGNFSWLQCNQQMLSSSCEKFMIHVECFYQCSPIVGYWKGPYPGSFNGVPLCSAFCNEWYDACKDDMTCAKNWLTDFNTTLDGKNLCKSPCRKFSEVFQNGKDLCENMWGQSFKYKVPAESFDCVHLDFSNYSVADGFRVAMKYFGNSAGLLQWDPLSGLLAAVLSLCLTLWRH